MPSYLAIPGIPGDSMAARHKNEIEIDTWSFGCSLATGGFGTGARANRPDLTDLTLTCRSGSASPRLLEHCATGRALPEAVLTSGRDADRSSIVTEVRLTDVLVSGYTVTGNGDDMRDEFRLSFATVTFTVRRPRPDGSIGDPVTTTQPAPSSPVPSPGSGGVWRPRQP